MDEETTKGMGSEGEPAAALNIRVCLNAVAAGIMRHPPLTSVFQRYRTNIATAALPKPSAVSCVYGRSLMGVIKGGEPSMGSHVELAVIDGCGNMKIENAVSH